MNSKQWFYERKSKLKHLQRIEYLEQCNNATKPLDILGAKNHWTY